MKAIVDLFDVFWDLFSSLLLYVVVVESLCGIEWFPYLELSISDQ